MIDLNLEQVQAHAASLFVPRTYNINKVNIRADPEHNKKFRYKRNRFIKNRKPRSRVDIITSSEDVEVDKRNYKSSPKVFNKKVNLVESDFICNDLTINMVKTTPCDDNVWIIDTGADAHICNSLKYFDQTSDCNILITSYDDHKQIVNKMGDIPLRCGFNTILKLKE